LDVDLVAASTLILVATREHRGAVVRLLPSAQRRTFTLAQAGRIAAWQVGQGVRAPCVGEDDFAARLYWLRDQLDAGRGLAPLPSPESADDIPDPHDGEVSHQAALREVYIAVRSLAELLQPDVHCVGVGGAERTSRVP
jgi:protein-tyrosine phosphatase